MIHLSCQHCLPKRYLIRQHHFWRKITKFNKLLLDLLVQKTINRMCFEWLWNFLKMSQPIGWKSVSQYHMSVSCRTFYLPVLQGKWLQRFGILVNGSTLGLYELAFIKCQLTLALNLFENHFHISRNDGRIFCRQY